MTTPVNSYALLDGSDQEYPQIKLLHPSSREVSENGLKAGNLLDTLSGEISKKLSLIILGIRKEFRVWREEEGLSKFPEYLSDDMNTLRHFNPETGEKIGEEPLLKSKEWLNRKTNKRAKTQYFFLGVKPTNNTPVFFRVGGLGFKRARRFLNQARTSGKQLFEFVTELSVATEPSQFGPKYVLHLQKSDQPLPSEWDIEKGAQQCQKFIQQSRPVLASPAENQ